MELNDKGREKARMNRNVNININIRIARIWQVVSEYMVGIGF